MAYFEQLTHAAKNAGARYQYNCPPCCVLKADIKEFTILKFNGHWSTSLKGMIFP
jgi:hypothetical protein